MNTSRTRVAAVREVMDSATSLLLHVAALFTAAHAGDDRWRRDLEEARGLAGAEMEAIRSTLERLADPDAGAFE